MIELERKGEVFLLRMRAGENRLSRGLVAEIGRALDEVEGSSGAAALVTTGEGRFYSNGLDLDGLMAGTREEAAALMLELQALFARLLVFPVVTVAALNGHAIAAGMMLALAQDFRIMRRERGFLCLPEIDLATGQALTPGMYALLGARLTPATFHEALITGRRYDAEAALRAGIIEEATPEADVLPHALERASSLADKDRGTLTALKQGLYAKVLQALEPASAAKAARAVSRRRT